MQHIRNDERARTSASMAAAHGQYSALAVAAALAALAFAIRMVWIDHPALWKDEIFSLVYTWYSYAHHFDLHRVTDVHPPLYPVMLKAWISAFGDSRVAIRGLSALFGALTIVPLYFMVREWLDPKIAVLSSLFLAVNPVHIHFSRELRNYSLLSLSLMAASYFFLSIYSDRKHLSHKSSIALFSLFLALCFYVHYIAITFFALFGLAAVIILAQNRDWSAFQKQCAGILIAVLICIPQSIHMFGYSMAGGAERNEWIAKTNLLIFYQQTLAAYPFPALFKPIMAAIYAFGLWKLYQRSKIFFSFTVMFTGFAFLLCAFLGLFKGIYLVRSIQCFILLSGVLLAMAIARLPRPVMLLAAAALVGLNLWSARGDYPRQRIADPGLAFKGDLSATRPRAVFYDNDLEYYMKAVGVDVRGWHGLFLDKVAEGSAKVEDHLVRCHQAGSSCGTTALIIAVKPGFFQQEALEWNGRADAWKQAYGAKVDKTADGFRLVVFD